MKGSILITGSAGLIGSESALFFAARGYQIIGIDNDVRAKFFGPDASTRWNLQALVDDLGSRYVHHDVDIRDVPALRFTKGTLNDGCITEPDRQDSFGECAGRKHQPRRL